MASRNSTLRPVPVGQYLIIDPRVCHGQLTFKGTRVPVETVLHFLSEGDSVEKILESWPYLKRAAISEAVRLAAAALVGGVQKKKSLVQRAGKKAV